MNKILKSLMILLSLLVMTAYSSPTMPLIKVKDIASMQVVRNMPGGQDHLYKYADEAGKQQLSKLSAGSTLQNPVMAQRNLESTHCL